MAFAPTLFEARRLSFRGIEQTDLAFLHEVKNGDALSQARSSTRLFRPESQDRAESLLNELRDDALMAAMICMKPEFDHQTSAAAAVADATPTVDSSPRQIGYVKLSRLPRDRTHHRRSIMALHIVQAEQGKGFGGEAIAWALDWAFSHAGLHRVEIGYLGYNEGAGRLYRRIGFREEGRRREAIWWGGRWWDAVEMGILEGEWGAMREESLDRERDERGEAMASGD